MSFRITTILWVFALFASGMATFGVGGIVIAGLVIGVWTWIYYSSKPTTTLGKLLLALFFIAIVFALLLPAMPSAREAARRSQCMNNLKQISLALLNYHDVHKSFPSPYIADANGNPIHSWRVLILPFLEEKLLYQQYDFNEPWDGPKNSQMAEKIPEVYRCPSGLVDETPLAEKTQYFAVVGPGTAWSAGNGRRITEFTDGVSNTILVIEASGLGVNWMEPRDVSVDEAIDLLTKKPRSGHMHLVDGFLTATYYETSYRNVAYCDGHVEWTGQLSDDSIARALLTVAGGETIPPDIAAVFGKPDVSRTIVKWGKVYALCAFILLSLLPIKWVGQRSKQSSVETSE